MNNEDNIDELLTQLNRLRIEESNIIKRIIQVRNKNNNEETNNEREQEEELKIGDTVRILNPRRFQENTGVISKIGASRVTITPRKGIKIIRHPRNIQKIV